MSKPLDQLRSRRQDEHHTTKIDPDDLETRSANPVAENLDHMQALFPEAFVESKVDFGVLQQLLGGNIDEREEKYGLNWYGKRRARQLALTPSTATLRPHPEESIDWDTTQNLLIEGDNLEVLKLLQKSYASKVSLIYIDPPYNTGKDFIYPDDYRDNMRNYLEITGQADVENRKLTSNTEASGRFHTDWLNMMYPRLKLARTLLRDDGFLFMTVDDTEVHNLRQLTNEIFGEENFVANVVWEKKYTRANDAQFFSDNHDHILVFAKNKAISKLFLQPRNADQQAAYRNPDNHPKGPWKATPLHAKSGGNTSPFTFKNGIAWAPPPGTYRRFSDETMAKMDRAHEIWMGLDGRSTPSRKSFLSEVKSGVTAVTIWLHNEVGHNHEANNELRELLGQGVFNNPKPTRLVRRMIELASSSSADPSIILDFFAGSGTTGHAVMIQNSIDGGHRRHISVQLPERIDSTKANQKVAAHFCERLGIRPNIAELTKERLRRAANKIKEENPMLPCDVGFRIFRLDTSNIRAWDPDPDDLEVSLLRSIDHVKSGRSDQDILYELLLKFGLDLCAPIETRTIAGRLLRSIGTGTLIACLDKKIARADVKQLAFGIAEWHAELEPARDSTVVFLDQAFEDDVAKANLVATLEQLGLSNIRSL